MNTYLNIVAIITAELLLTLLLSKLVRRTVSIDFLWRLTLIIVAATPLILWCREPVSSLQWKVAILPSTAADISHQRMTSDAERKSHISQARSVNELLAARTSRQPTGGPADSDAALAKQLNRSNPDTSLPPQTITDSKFQTPSTVSQKSVLETYRDLALEIIGFLWISVASILGVRIVLAMAKAYRITHSARVVNDSSLIALNESTAKQVGVSHPARLTTSDAVDGPVVTGIFTSTIILPPTMTDPRHHNDVRNTLLHEYGHIRRSDVPFDLLLRIVVALLWPHPLVHVMARELRRLREEICDNHVLVHESPIRYSETLLRMAVGKSVREPFLIGLGIESRPQSLEARITDLLSSHRQTETQSSSRFRWTVTALAAVVISSSLFIRVVEVAANQTETTPATATNDPALDQANALPAKKLEFRVQVVDSNNKPVGGAKVKTLDVYCNQFHVGVETEESSHAITDADGYATILLSEKFSTMRLPERLEESAAMVGVNHVRLHIDHPDHPVWEDSHYFAKPASQLSKRQAARLGVVEVDDWKPSAIILGDAVTVHVRTKFNDRSEAPTRLFPNAPSYSSHDWSETNGIITVKRMELTGRNPSRWLQVVHAPEEGHFWFSDAIDLKHLLGDVIEVESILNPGVRVEGRLIDLVPRPVKDGRVIAHISDLSKATHGVRWQAVAPINPDGTFVLESVPPNLDLQLIALCDGFLSRPMSEAEIKQYADDNEGFPTVVPGLIGGSGQLWPQLYRLGEGVCGFPHVWMERSATCKVTAVDSDLQPLKGVTISFSPNHSFHSAGSWMLGEATNFTDYVRQEVARTENVSKPPGQKWDSSRYSAITNKEGVAIVGGLPGGLDDSTIPPAAMFTAAADDLIPLPNSWIPDEYRNLGILRARLVSGETTSTTVKMVPFQFKVGEETSVASNRSDEQISDVANIKQIRGQVVDEAGNPIRDVTVFVDLVCDLNVRTDADGKFHHSFNESLWSEEDLREEVPKLPVRFVKEGYAAHMGFLTASDRDNTITLHSKTYFEGLVTGVDGKPATNIRVVAFGAEQEIYNMTYSNFGAETRTDAHGRYRLLVDPSEYIILAGNSSSELAWLPEDPSDLQNSMRNYTDRPQISIDPNEIKTLDIRLERGVEFRAKFIDSDTGDRIPGIALFPVLYPPMFYIEFESQGTPKYVQSDPLGAVSIPMMSKGQTMFMISDDGMSNTDRKYLTHWSDDATEDWKQANGGSESASKGKVQSEIVFDLQPGQPTVTIKLTKGAVIKGTVVDPDGKPVVNATVKLASPSRSSIGYGFQAETSDNGQFELGLPQTGGNVLKLVAFEHTPRAYPEWSNGIVSIKPFARGETISGIKIQLTRPGKIKGRIVDRAGTPMASVFVQALSADNPEIREQLPSTVSRRDGTFLLSNVAPGRHFMIGKSGTIKDNGADEVAVKVQSNEETNVGDIVVPIDD